MQDSAEEVLVLLHKLLEELQFPSLKNISSQLPKESEQVCVLVSQDFGESFLIYTSHEMVAQSSANFPIFRGHARQRGRGSEPQRF